MIPRFLPASEPEYALDFNQDNPDAERSARQGKEGEALQVNFKLIFILSRSPCDVNLVQGCATVFSANMLRILFQTAKTSSTTGTRVIS